MDDEQPKRRRIRQADGTYIDEPMAEYVERLCEFQGRPLPQRSEPPHPTLSAAALKNIREGRGPGAEERIDAIFEDRAPVVSEAPKAAEQAVPAGSTPAPGAVASLRAADDGAAGRAGASLRVDDDEYGEPVLVEHEREPGEDDA